jgi:hypothetical protein
VIFLEGGELQMPQVTIKSGIPGADGQEETLTEYICDWPDCPNIAVQVLGFIREIRACSAVCAEHAAVIAARAKNDSTRS